MILISFGTRPEYIKVKPLLELMQAHNIPYKTVFTGQHSMLLDQVVTDYTILIEDGPNRLNSIVTSILKADHIFTGITYILVQGDTTSVFAMALSAFHRQIKIIHLEAGLRTNDRNNPYPEEANRQLVSRIADVHLCATEDNKKNLLKENIPADNIHVVGNTGLDGITNTRTIYGNIVLVTLHRRENHEIIDKWFTTINKLAQQHPELEFILPIHPNPNVQKHKDLLTKVHVIDPVQHVLMQDLIRTCRLAISDSGGLQEECSFFNKKIIVCRKTTERPESIGVHSFLCPEPEKLPDLFKKINDNHVINAPCPYGDGKASQKIINIFKKLS